MDTETRARIFKEGGKVVGDLIKVIALRPKGTRSPETPLSEIAQTAPETENVVDMSHEPEKPPKIEDISVACVPCAMGHYGTCSGLLNEAMRFAKKEGIASGQVIDRVNMCLDELNTMERVDLRPELLMDLPKWEKGLANKALTGSRSLRHSLESLGSVDDLEKIAATTQTTRNEIGREWFKQRLSNMSKEEKAEAVEKAEATQATEEPEMSLKEAKNLAAEEATKEVEKRWTERKSAT